MSLVIYRLVIQIIQIFCFFYFKESNQCVVLVERFDFNDVMENGSETASELFVKQIRLKKMSLRKTPSKKTVITQFVLPPVKLKTVLLIWHSINFLFLIYTYIYICLKSYRFRSVSQVVWRNLPQWKENQISKTLWKKLKTTNFSKNLTTKNNILFSYIVHIRASNVYIILLSIFNLVSYFMKCNNKDC